MELDPHPQAIDSVIDQRQDVLPGHPPARIPDWLQATRIRTTFITSHSMPATDSVAG